MHIPLETCYAAGLVRAAVQQLQLGKNCIVYLLGHPLEARFGELVQRRERIKRPIRRTRRGGGVDRRGSGNTVIGLEGRNRGRSRRNRLDGHPKSRILVVMHDRALRHVGIWRSRTVRSTGNNAHRGCSRVSI